MPPLFFLVAAVSSDSADEGIGVRGGRLALVPGAPGWQSARCPTYPQEVLLELQSAAEINLVEVGARGPMTPTAVDIFVSADGDPTSLDGVAFNQVGTVRFDSNEAVPRTTAERKERLKLFTLCSGQVKLLVHKPLAGEEAGNTYKQVAIETVQLVGQEDARPSAHVSARPVKRAHRPEHVEVQDALLELGIPLDVLPPPDADTLQFPEVDEGTKICLSELRDKHKQLIADSKFFEAERITEHMAQLRKAGVTLRELLQKRRDLVEAESYSEAEQVQKQVAQLERHRLDLAALWMIGFWEKKMTLQR